MPLVTLHYPNGEEVLVNLNNVTRIYRTQSYSGEGAITRVCLVGEDNFEVKEPLAAVKCIIEKEEERHERRLAHGHVDR